MSARNAIANLFDRCGVSHIFCEGSRRHVFSYALYEPGNWPPRSVAATWCSEPFCEYNRSALECVTDAGLDPAKICPLPALSEAIRSLSLTQPEAKEARDGTE